MECTNFKIIQKRSKDKNIHLAFIYRPPDSSTIHLANELADFMEENINNMGNLLSIGDINIKINVGNDPGTMIFNDFLDGFNLANTVNFPTHHQDNTLDLVVQDAGSDLTVSTKQGHLVSDHNLVLFEASTSSKMDNFKTISFRKLKDIVMKKLCYYLKTNVINEDPKNTDINRSVKVYDEVLRSTLQEMAPIMTKQVKFKKKHPWFSRNIKNGISERHKLQREWKKDPDDTNKFIDFYIKHRKVDNMMDRAERSCYLSSLHDNRFNIKKIYVI